MSMRRSLSVIACAAMLSFSCGCTQNDDEMTMLEMLQNAPPSRPNPPTSPTKSSLAAAHILIMHRYSERRPNDVTRTKDEALALAQEIAAKAHAADADFAALAREYSDGPSGSNGGDLGSFEPTAMVPAFSKATQDLQIGAVSDPIETQFGYHIILRREP